MRIVFIHCGSALSRIVGYLQKEDIPWSCKSIAFETDFESGVLAITSNAAHIIHVDSDASVNIEVLPLGFSEKLL